MSLVFVLLDVDARMLIHSLIELLKMRTVVQ